MKREKIAKILEDLHAYYEEELENARKQKWETSELLYMGKIDAIERVSQELLNPTVPAGGA